ncbi:myelin-oligodendrocyte glycoprotein-like isoform X3 [Neopelma chrysocephalum]|uniref:myelin-oligodendrocyte glycoprotein-like isoform X3 n=1 Tax=Neopelma chrysocephalum TaxID=114329 RepID=UPI000FCD1C74|nr:myelin-oligodendrocyte glycoprotein-like isoform X3 [Neopelma chrysocephalum]
MARPGSTPTTRSSRCCVPAQLPQQTHTSLFFLRGSLPAPLTVTGPPGPITVAKGEDVVLPCSFSPGQNAQDMEVTWFREQFSPFVHRYKLGQDQYGEQMLQYQGRTGLRKDGFAKGSADLKIFHVRLSDTGSYTCFVKHGSDYDEAVVELKVTDPFFQDAHPWKIALGVVLVAVVALLISTVYLFKIKGDGAAGSCGCCSTSRPRGPSALGGL